MGRGSWHNGSVAVKGWVNKANATWRLQRSGKQPWHTGHLAPLQPQERLGAATSCFDSLVGDARCWLWQSTRVLFFPSAF